jgi:hypothetical protein
MSRPQRAPLPVRPSLVPLRSHTPARDNAMSASLVTVNRSNGFLERWETDGGAIASSACVAPVPDLPTCASSVDGDRRNAK